MKPFKEVIDGIRKAVLAPEVREDLAQMGEYMEQFANTAGENIQKAIDPTLSLSGKAADAAKVGEAVNAETTRAKAAEEENAKGIGRLEENLANFDKAIIFPNLIDSSKYVSGTFLTNGEIKDDADYSHIFVHVKPNTEYTYTQQKQGNLTFAYADANKQYIIGTWHGDIYGTDSFKQTFMTTENTEYVVFNADNNCLEKSQLEIGNETVGFYAFGTGYISRKVDNFNELEEKVSNIEGWVVNVESKNLIDPEKVVRESDGIYAHIDVPILPGVNYVFSKGDDTSNLFISEKNNLGAVLSQKELYGVNSKLYSFTSNANTAILTIRTEYTPLTTISQLEKGTEKTEFESYTGTRRFIADDIYLKTALDNKDSIDVLNAEVEDIKNKVYEKAVTPYIEQEKSLIYKSEQTLDKTVVRFLLFTDVHGSDILNDYTPDENATIYGNYGYKNYREFAIVARKIAEEIGVDFIVNLGDTINSTVDEASKDFNKAECKKRFAEFTRYIQGTVPYIYATAHHEMHPVNTATGEGTENALKHSEVYGIANRYTRNIEIVSNENDTNKNYYYFDLPIQKVRCIVLDSCCKTNFGYSDSEVSWLSNIALSTEYKILVFSHMGTKGNNTGIDFPPQNGTTVEAALNGKKVLGYFHGHTHWDNIIPPSDSGVDYPYISTVNAWCTKTSLPSYVEQILGNPTTYDRVYDTYSEYAFDVVSVDTENGNINMFRFGAGADRDYLPNS